MAYVQRFAPRGTDLATLDFFMRNRLDSVLPEPEKQQLLAQQIYDVALSRGVKAGNLRIEDLDYVFNEMQQGLTSPLPDVDTPPTPLSPAEILMSIPGRTGALTGDLLPRTAMQSPLEAMRHTRYFDSGDAVADAAGAFTYRFIDALSLGLLGGAGGILKRLGVTENNFWTESIGKMDNLLGMDLGEGGLKEGDTTAGRWMQRAGEFFGFIAPAAVTLGGSAAASVAGRAGAKAVQAAVKAEAIGGEVAGKALRASAARHFAAKEGIEATTKVTVDVLNKAPANLLFAQGHKAVNKLLIGEATQRVASNALVDAVKTSEPLGRVLGKLGAQRAGAVTEAFEGAAKKAAEQAYAAAQTQSPGAIKAAGELARGAGKAFEDGVLDNPEVLTPATNLFENLFMKDTVAKLGLDISKPGHADLLYRLTTNASKVFEESLKAARRTGLLSAQEKAYRAGFGVMGMGLARAGENAVSHVVNMVALGAVTRVAHPLGEPEAFGISETDDWQATKDIAKYWLRGQKASPFEGVAGDIFTGLMFGTGGGMRLIPAFQSNRVKNPAEMFSIMLGGSPDRWKGVMTKVDRAINPVYDMARKAGMEATEETGGVGGFIRRYMRRNKIDYADIAENNPAGFQTVATNYLNFMKRNPDLMPATLPFNDSDIFNAARAVNGLNTAGNKVALDARQKIVSAMSAHFDKFMADYSRLGRKDLLKDVAQFAVISTATSFASSPQLWLTYAKGDSDIHPADLVMHTLFSAMMARHPYYVDGGNQYLRAIRDGMPVSSEMQARYNLMRVRGAMRNLGVKDSAFMFDGTEGNASSSAGHFGPMSSDTEINEAAKEAASGPVRYTMVPNLEDAGPGTVSAREVRDFIMHIRARAASKGDLSDDVLVPDADGKPMVLSGDLEGNATAYNRLVNTLGILKERLVKAGYMSEGDPFRYSAISRQNSAFFQRSVGEATRLMSLNPSGLKQADNGIIGAMKRIVGTNGKGDLRYISLKANADNPIDPVIARVVDGYNELVKIAGDFRMSGVDVDEKGNAKPREIDLSTERELFDEIDQLVATSSEQFGKSFGVSEKMNLGSGKFHNLLIEGLLESKMNHSTTMMVHKGVLYAPNGEHVNADRTIRKLLVELGIGENVRGGDGKTVTVLRPIDLTEYEGSMGAGRPSKAEVLRNFFNYVSGLDGIHVKFANDLTSKDEPSVSKEQLDALLSNTTKLFDAREGVEIKGYRDGVIGLLADVGINFENKAMVGEYLRDIARNRNERYDERHFRFLSAARAAGLIVRDKYGNERVSPAVVAQLSENPEDMVTGQFRRGADLPEYLEGIGEDLASRSLESALSPEQRQFFTKMVNELTEGGKLAGTTMPMEYFDTGGEIPDGIFTAFNRADHPNLEQFVREMDYLRNRTIGDAILELDTSISEVNGALKDMTGIQKSRKLRARQRNLKKLMRYLSHIKSGSKLSFMMADKFMFEKGYLTVGEGPRKLKLFLNDDKKLAEAVKDLGTFIEMELSRDVAADESIDRNIAASRAEEIRRKYAGKDGPDRPSAANFFVDLGLDFDSAVRSKTMRMITDIGSMIDVPNEKTGEVEITSANAAQRLRHSIRTIIDRNFFGIGHERAIEALEAYSDNYLVSLSDELRTTMVETWSLDPGTDFKKIVLGGMNYGDKPTVGIAEMEVPSPTSGAKRTNYTVKLRSVADTSTDLDMRRRGFARFSYISKESLRLSSDPRKAEIEQQQFEDWLFKNGLVGRYVDSHHNVSRKGIGPSVLLDEIRQGGGKMAVELPSTMASASDFLTAAKTMLDEFDSRTILSDDLKDPISALRLAVQQIESAIENGKSEADLRKFVLAGEDLIGTAESKRANEVWRNRITMWKNIFRLVRQYNQFGSEAIVDAFNTQQADPKSNAVNKLIARSKLSAAGSVTSMTRGTFNAGLNSYLRSGGGVHANGGRRMNTAEFADDQGLVLDEHGNVSGYKALVFDGKAAKDENGRPTERIPGGIIMRYSTITAIWHAMGHNTDATVDPRTGIAQNGFAVAKVSFWDASRGAFITKDVIVADQRFERIMDEHGVNMIVSKDAVKVKSGQWSADMDAATIKYADGSHDIIKKISEGAGGEFEASPMVIPVEATRWTHAVDVNPGHASRSPQLVNFKGQDLIQSVNAMIQAKQGAVIQDFARIFGGLNRNQRMLLGYIMSNRGRLLSEQEMKKTINKTSSLYMSMGGHLASPTDYGGGSYTLDVLKNKLIADEIFRIRTTNGSQAVYSDDVADVISVGQGMSPFQDAFLTHSVDTGFAAFRLWDPKLASEANARTFNWGNRPNHFNSEGNEDRAGAELPDEPSDIAHFRLWTTGREAAVFNGLMAARRSPRNGKIAVTYRAMARDGSYTTGAGATTIHEVLKGVKDDAVAEEIALAYSDAWHFALTSKLPQSEIGAGIQKILNAGLKGRVPENAKMKMVEDIGVSRRLAYGELMDEAGNISGLISTVEGQVENYRAMNALGHIFGSYNYYERSSSTDNGLGMQTFGLTTISQRHPSIRINDTVPTMTLGFLDPRDGNQYKMNYRDAELKMMADQDEDHIHFWHDYGVGELSEALRNRALGGLFTTPEVQPMPERRYFQSPGSLEARTYDTEWVDRQNWGKAGIGLISKALTTASDALSREIAFEITIGNDVYLVAPKVYVDAGTRKIHDDPSVSVMDRTQDLLQGAFQRLSVRHSQFLDTKAGASDNPREIDLQGEVLGEFFGLFKKGVNGLGETVYEHTPRGLADREEAMRALKAALSPIYQISSLGKDVIGADGTSSQAGMEDLLHVSSRYDAVFGPDSDVRARLQDIISIALASDTPRPTKGKRGKKLQGAVNFEAAKRAQSVHVITSSETLRRKSVYDVMASTILKSEDMIHHGDRRPFLTEDEMASFYQGKKGLMAVNPADRTAMAARFVANSQNLGRSLLAMNNRLKNGESMLATEAAAVRSMLRSGVDYWRKTEDEVGFQRGKRMIPDNPLELRSALDDYADASGINLARAMALSKDLRPEEAQKRAKRSMFIRGEYRRLMRQLMNDQSQKDPQYWVDNEVVQGIMDNYVADYVATFGREGNEVVAVLDLLAPEAYGYFVHRGTEITRYKKFNQMLFSSAIKAIGGDGTGMSETPMWGNVAVENVMSMMARGRATASAIVAGNPEGLHELHRFIEAIETGGKSVMAALQYSELKSPDRRKEAKRNVYLAQMNSAFNGLLREADESGFGDPAKNALGFRDMRNASRFLAQAISGGDSVRRARILNTMKLSKTPIPSEMLSNESLDESARLSVYTKADDVIGNLESALISGERRLYAQEQAAKPKNKRDDRDDAQLRDYRVRQRESHYLSKMLSSIDANTEKRPTVAGIDMTTTSASSVQMVFDAQDALRMKSGVCY